jgi:patatin-like phospholipase/acyl hydrolase
MKVWELFDLICGTSTGGILALALGLLKLSGMK